MKELITKLYKVQDAYDGFVHGVLAYVKNDPGRCKRVMGFIKNNPEAMSSDILEYILEQRDLYNDVVFAKYSFLEETENEFTNVYNDEEIIDGHAFKHVAYGIYSARPNIIIPDWQQMKTLTNAYKDIMFCIYKSHDSKDEAIHIAFAYYKDIGTGYSDFERLSYLNAVHGVYVHQKIDDPKFDGLFEKDEELEGIDYLILN